ncbi:hypothetical protein [Streptomyces sp. NPDC090022]|uniref:hypothetical protein n=1 Tax=Streptomyces sp. NPDC090022 TaxID=3365920 RepID=UPI003807E653
MRLRNRRAGRAGAVVVAALALAFAAVTPSGAAPRVPAADLPYAGSTGVGVHNAYEKSTYAYFADALDSGAALLELDVWTNFFGASWRVSHSNPVGNDTVITSDWYPLPGVLRTVVPRG